MQDLVGAKFYCPHALADTNQRIRIREKTLEFSSTVLSTLSPSALLTDSEWQWHQLGHVQVCTSLQTDNHNSNPPLSFYRPDALPAAQPTASKH